MYGFAENFYLHVTTYIHLKKFRENQQFNI